MRGTKLMSLAALAAVPSMAQAQAQAGAACMTRAEANALFVVALPDVIEGTRAKCASALPAGSFLSSQGPALVSRYRQAGTGNLGLARVAFLKMAGEDKSEEAKILAAMPEVALRGLLGTAFSVVVANDIKVADCPNIDRFVAALSPLPPSNVAEVVTGLIAIAGGKADDPFRLCKES
jgi:hypothetical protein